MAERQEEPGQIVRAVYKTGEYIGEIMEADGRRVLVQVLAVLAHPKQGDLHHPNDPDVPLFHERPASHFREKVWVPAGAVKPYEGAVPAYRESLLAAAEAETERLSRLQRWAERSLEQLQGLTKEYKYRA
ncbi:sporulation phosphorelay system protein KapB [Cohnella sp. AR92]|uniref:sporulation phosphorelay system protein KapB n=1 Tax=Cohnella sp. AR92 TaxID=648716 RepID=UPI000F8C5565|nr:sporulation phosphorelay system protein KapB [Cohnella sp. AR92]RUS47806.1 kinase [Cohnella sp. AR92]